MSKWLKVSIASLITALGILVLSLSSLGLLYFVLIIWSSNSSRVKEEKDFESYQHYRVNPRNNETFFGIIQSNNHLVHESFSSYEDDVGWRNLISDFGDEEYDCTGSCYCLEDRRIASGLPLARGLKYLVAAVSSIVAFDIAKSRFEEECREQTDEYDCPTEQIRAEVDSCENVYLMSKKGVIQKDQTKKKTQTKSKKKMKLGKSDFICQGHCVLHPPSTEEHNAFSTGKGKLLTMERLKLAWLIFRSGGKCKKHKMDGKVRAKDEMKAIDNFMYSALHFFCMANTEVEFKMKKAPGMYKRSMCAGYIMYQGRLQNPSIVCRKVTEEVEESS